MQVSRREHQEATPKCLPFLHSCGWGGKLWLLGSCPRSVGQFLKVTAGCPCRLCCSLPVLTLSCWSSLAFLLAGKGCNWSAAHLILAVCLHCRDIQGCSSTQADQHGWLHSTVLFHMLCDSWCRVPWSAAPVLRGRRSFSSRRYCSFLEAIPTLWAFCW